MIHWTSKYIGQSWTDEHCCAWYFAIIQREVFGREIDPITIDGAISSYRSARLLASIAVNETEAARLGFRKTNDPIDGDAVFLTQRATPHHIGTFALVNGVPSVVHALENVGVVLSDFLNLRANGWKIVAFFTPVGVNNADSA